MATWRRVRPELYRSVGRVGALLAVVCYDYNTMSDERPNGEDLIGFIATTVETMRDQMATKSDLIKLNGQMDTMRDQMATKDDLSRLETIIRGDFEQVHLRFRHD